MLNVNSRLFEIIIIEDDDGHAALIERNLRREGLNNKIIRFSDGREGLKYLKNINHNTIYDNSLYYMVLLDLNMPDVDGYAVLSTLKNDDKIKSIPVIVFTSTDSQDEIVKCYRSGCNLYVTKPVDYSDFNDRIKKITQTINLIKIAAC